MLTLSKAKSFSRPRRASTSVPTTMQEPGHTRADMSFKPTELLRIFPTLLFKVREMEANILDKSPRTHEHYDMAYDWISAHVWHIQSEQV